MKARRNLVEIPAPSIRVAQATRVIINICVVSYLYRVQRP